MINLVPSIQVSEYLDKVGHTFTDSERATLIWNAVGCSRDEKLMALEDMALSTEDAKLRQQIKERLDFENEKVRRFVTNQDNDYIYVVNDSDGISCGFFREHGTARSYAKRQDESCTIAKQKIVDGFEIPKVESVGRWNPNLFPDKEYEITTKDYCGDAVAEEWFDEKGNLVGMWSTEMSIEEEDVVDEYKVDRFEFKFLNIPFPPYFSEGAPVKHIPTGKYGIIASGSENWEEFIQRVNAGLYVDYSDMCITVEFLTDDGMWCHNHINPIFLDIEMPKTKDNHELACALEALSDYWSGSGSEEIVLKYSRQYADAKRKPRTIDAATSVQDIII
ncbi:MAG: hypothetical protein IJX85_01230 [Lachnospiraceae bacterium]|nr:hypothetical protein [Lachnospiraceae bacterium]